MDDRALYPERVEGAGERAFAWGLTLAFGVVCGVTLAMHEMWRDELQAWLIARDSHGLGELFRNLKFEGHPYLWYLLLYPLSHASANPVSMQVLHWGIATVAAFVVARFAPFSRAQRALLVFGYFPLFEYGVISRNYGLGMCLAFLLCAGYPRLRRTGDLLPTGLVLAAMTMTTVYSFIVAIAYGGMVAWVLVRDAAFRGRVLARPGRAAVGVGIVLVCAAATAVQLKPPPSSEFAVGWQTHVVPAKVAAALGVVWKAYVPVPKFQYAFWNTNILQGRLAALQPPLAVVLVVGAVWLLRRSAAALALYALGTGAVVTFTYVKYFGYLRHQGALFVLLIAALWIATVDRRARVAAGEARDGDGPRRAAVTGLLVLHCVLGLYACALDWGHPFSDGRAVANYLKANGLGDREIVGHWDYMVSPLTAYLGRDVYLADEYRFGTFIRWDSKRAPITPEATVERARAMAAERGRDVLLILTPPPNEGSVAVVHAADVELLKAFDDAIEPSERAWLYVVHPGASAGK